MTESRKWKGKTGGSIWGQWGLIVFFKLLDVRLGYLLMALVVPFYMFFSYKNYKAIYHFFRRQLALSLWKSFMKTYVNHYRFGQVILDRFLIFARRKNPFEIEVVGNEHFNRLIEGEKGFIIASSHIGNFEIGGYLLRSEKKRINALVYPGETETVQKHRAKVLNRNNIHLIPVSDDMSHLFAIHTALQKGEIVSMPCDRNLGSPKCVECDFLRGKADFPVGAFAIATTLDLEVLSIFVMKESSKKYAVHVKPVAIETPEAQESKQERTARYVRSFVNEVEAIVRRYPEQWFNYYEFWKQ
ncbi:MAG: lysophospholipid acyltransferase family protein [Tannerellaceae bacterium]|jgi:predicted LPLAT superfamily acyltransferase|nr:lysophospholipid acyltransferase family protein [Tannerellaceae bacterium]